MEIPTPTLASAGTMKNYFFKGDPANSCLILIPGTFVKTIEHLLARLLAIKLAMKRGNNPKSNFPRSRTMTGSRLSFILVMKLLITFSPEFMSEQRGRSI